MRRTSFAHKVYAPPPGPPVRPATRRGTYAGRVSLVLVAVGVEIRSGVNL